MSCIILLFLVHCTLTIDAKGLIEEFTWDKISYKWSIDSNAGGTFSFDHKNKSDKFNFRDGFYIFENNVPMGANLWKNKLFVTIPRRRAGIPSTLNYVWLNTTKKHNVPLIPYPDWKSNQYSLNESPERLVSVYRTAVDDCDRLWMVDTGLVEPLDEPLTVHRGAVVIIDLHTNKIIRRYTLKIDDVKLSSAFANIVVDTTANTCNDAYAYIPDLSGYGLVVYSFRKNESWRVSHNYFYLESQAGNFIVGGIKFQWNDGIFSVSLSDIEYDGFRTAYFHSMAGTHIYSVSTKILKDYNLATRHYHDDDFKVVLNRGLNAQTSASALHASTGVLFLGLVNQNGLGCWNTKKKADITNFDIVKQDEVKFIYPSDVKVSKDNVIVLTNRMPIFIYGQLNYEEVNFRIWIANVKDAVKDTVCAA